MTAGRPVGRQSATRCGPVPVRVVGAPLFCLAGGGQAGLSALHATGTLRFWRPRCDSRSRGSRQPIQTQRHDANRHTSTNPGNVLPHDLARQRTRFRMSARWRFNV